MMLRSCTRSLGVESLPWFQVQRARIVLGVAAGERDQRPWPSRLEYDPSTIWRVCRRYEDRGCPAS